MIKNKLYPLIEKYINEYLYGFNKEQLQLGLTNGIINLNKLNLRPDAINSKIDSKNIPLWIKAGLISKIEVGCSLMNFIGEKPIDVLIEDIDVLLTPSYKWIIQNVKSFLQETPDRINDEYDMAYNNSHDIYTQKVNVIDSSIFKQNIIQEIFTDGSKISKYINKIFLMCLKFYYSKDYAVNLTIKNLHIRFEDDQLINYIGDIAFGIKIQKINATLSSEGIMKRDSFKLEKLDIYWELQPKILISSELLTSSLQYITEDENYTEGNLKLEESYYKKLNSINFSNFKYIPNTAFIVENFNCNGKIGTQADNSTSIDIFSNKKKNFKVYIQFASSELNLNIFPELATIFNNFRKFSKSYVIIKEVESFKPMKKPMDKDNPVIKKMKDYLKSPNHSKKLEKAFKYKEKMYVRDWIYYFFWCKKCSTMDGKNINPLRMEFCRFFNICYGLVGEDQKMINSIDKKDKKDSVSNSYSEFSRQFQKDKPTDENPNPENVVISLTVQMLIKGFNVKLNTNYSKGLKDFISYKMTGGDIKFKLDKDKFDFSFNCKDIIVEPSKIIKGERVVISKKVPKKINLFPNQFENSVLINNINGQGIYASPSMNQLSINNPLRSLQNTNENAIDKLLKKNELFNEKMKLLNNALFQVEQNQNKTEANETNFNKQSNINSEQSKSKVLRSKPGIIKQNKPPIPINSNKAVSNNKTIISNILCNTIDNTKENKNEEEKKKKDFLLSQKIAEYNRNISQNSSTISSFKRSSSNQKLRSGNKSNNINTNDKNVDLYPIEIKANSNGQSISLHYIKSNKHQEIDSLDIKFGTIRLNLFLEYASSFFSVISEYKNLSNKSSFNKNNKQKSLLNIQKQLIYMKKYIYNYLQKIPDNKKDNQIKEYIKFLKHENEIADNILKKKGGFEVNYILSMFSNGMNVNIDYENFECVYYKKNEFNLKNSHQILGKFLIPNMDFNFQFNASSIIVKLFDFEFELNDLENSKILVQTLLQIIKEKMKVITVFIQPCFVELRKKYNQILEDKERILTEDNELNNQSNKYNQNNINMIHRNFNVLNNQINCHQVDELPEKNEEENNKNMNTENSDIINIKI